MRKILLALLLLPAIIFGQSETNNFITYDTVINAPYAGIKWSAKITRPANFFVPGHPDTATRSVILTIPGQGQMGTNLDKLDDFGPHREMAVRGWNRAVQLGDGTRYPIYITVISSVVTMTGREVHDVGYIFKNLFHVPQNRYFAAGLSQGGFGLTGAVLYESSPGNESGMKLFKAIAAFHGVSNEVTGGVTKPVTGWGRWAKQYGGRFFGLEGNATDNFRNVWRVSNAMNDSMPGSAYFSYTSVGSPAGSHSGWDTIYSPHQNRWRSVTPFGTYNTGSQGSNGINRMGTYIDYSNIYQYLLRQGDTTLAGTSSGGGNAAPTANAGSDQTITLPTNSVSLSGSGTDDVGIVSYAWSKISGPSTFTITSSSSQNTSVTGLIQGTYVFQLTTTDAGSLTATDQVTVIVNPAGNVNPTVNAGSNQTTTLPADSITVTATASDADGTIVSYLWTKISGGSATISSPSSATTKITGLAQGNYTFRCAVVDNSGGTSYDDMAVTVAPAPNVAPTVDAGLDQLITLPVNSTTVSAIGNDSDGSISSFAWTKISGGSATITNASASTTLITNLSVGSYVFQVQVTDDDGSTGIDQINITVEPSGSGTTYYWSSATTNILINNSIFGAPLIKGDSVIIPPRSGDYRSFSLNGLYVDTGYIVIYFQPGAKLAPSASSLQANIFTGPMKGVKIVGLDMQNHVDVVARMAGGYLKNIWFEGLNNKNSYGMGIVYTASFPNFDGNYENAFTGWKYTNCVFDGLYGSQTGGVGISTGKVQENGYWFDLLIENCTFKNYRASSNPGDAPSIFISLTQCYNCTVRNNSFDTLGVIATPQGHASAINFSSSLPYIYNNTFNEIFGNEIRGSFADVPSLGANYTGLGRVYNNITKNKRKYAFIEPRAVVTLPAYARRRSMPEVYNITMYRPAVGSGNSPYLTGLVDYYYAGDTLRLKNSVVVGIRDTVWGANPVIYNLSGGAGTVVYDTASNRRIQFYSDAGFTDSVYFRPSLTSQLRNTGVAVPNYITTDITGQKRPLSPGGPVSIGASEPFYIPVLPAGPLIRIKRGRIRFVPVNP